MIKMNVQKLEQIKNYLREQNPSISEADLLTKATKLYKEIIIGDKQDILSTEAISSIDNRLCPLCRKKLPYDEAYKGFVCPCGFQYKYKNFLYYKNWFAKNPKSYLKTLKQD